MVYKPYSIFYCRREVTLRDGRRHAIYQSILRAVRMQKHMMEKNSLVGRQPGKSQLYLDDLLERRRGFLFHSLHEGINGMQGDFDGYLQERKTRFGLSKLLYDAFYQLDLNWIKLPNAEIKEKLLAIADELYANFLREPGNITVLAARLAGMGMLNQACRTPHGPEAEAMGSGAERIEFSGAANARARVYEARGVLLSLDPGIIASELKKDDNSDMKVIGMAFGMADDAIKVRQAQAALADFQKAFELVKHTPLK